MEDYNRDEFRTLPWGPKKVFVIATMLLDMREAILDARTDEDSTELIELCALVKAPYNFIKEQIDKELHGKDNGTESEN